MYINVDLEGGSREENWQVVEEAICAKEGHDYISDGEKKQFSFGIPKRSRHR